MDSAICREEVSRKEESETHHPHLQRLIIIIIPAETHGDLHTVLCLERSPAGAL